MGEEAAKGQGPITLAWDTQILLPLRDDEPPPVVVAATTIVDDDKEQAQRDELLKMKDRELEEAIVKMRRTLEIIGSKLNDGGAKMRANLKRYQAEIESRKLRRLVECEDVPFEAKFEAFMAKLNGDDNVDAQTQFPEFGAPTIGTRETVGGHLLPMASADFLEKLVAKYGDFTTGVKRSRFSTLALSNLCAAVWDMSLTNFEDLNETQILKWKSAATDAESLGFNVTFFKAYLHMVVKALFGRATRVATAPRLEKMNTRIEVLKAELEMLEGEKRSLLAKQFVGVKGECLSIAATFDGCCVSEQLLNL